MKDKWQNIWEKTLEVCGKLIFIALVGYLTAIVAGLWIHLHQYAMGALK